MSSLSNGAWHAPVWSSHPSHRAPSFTRLKFPNNIRLLPSAWRASMRPQWVSGVQDAVAGALLSALLVTAVCRWARA
ncbi:hypothetical protein BD311DRAFT_99539 [Dichomitus squalens]|uniref:Uncharacterized protein n=1 Tax=Dichomitus squalens TaxID=114155 RepID=A0A4V2K171_9APHY|nr:hypothetical protein BD311DRAFT_99539 [Dichomitus squalens]